MRADKHLRVVLDTNVLISALGFQSETKAIWDLAEEGRFQVYTSAFIIQELERILIRKVGLESVHAERIVTAVLELAIVVEPKSNVSVIKNDLADNHILECARDARADVLVTGDLKHIRVLGHFEETEILTPREFISNYFGKD